MGMNAASIHFSTTGWSPTACGISETVGLLGTGDMAKVTCEACILVLAGAQSDTGITINGLQLREETDAEFRERIKVAVAAGTKGPFLRRLVDDVSPGRAT